MERSFTVSFFGAPGSGKSLQASELVRTMEAIHLDVGSVLRKIAQTETPQGREIADTMNHRMGLVSNAIICGALSGAFSEIPRDAFVIIDSAPRREDQIVSIDDLLQTFGRKVDLVVFIRMSEEESVRRISRRRICTSCERPFVEGEDFRLEAPVCPKCGEKLSLRKDDTEEGVRERFRVFERETLPVIEHFRRRGILCEVDGIRPIEEIAEEIARTVREKRMVS